MKIFYGNLLRIDWEISKNHAILVYQLNVTLGESPVLRCLGVALRSVTCHLCGISTKLVNVQPSCPGRAPRARAHVSRTLRHVSQETGGGALPVRESGSNLAFGGFNPCPVTSQSATKTARGLQHDEITQLNKYNNRCRIKNINFRNDQNHQLIRPRNRWTSSINNKNNCF